MNYSKIERFRKIVDRALSRSDTTLSYSRTVEAIVRLANIVHSTETEENVWYLGEHSLDLASIIVGSYWFFADYSGGQASPEYQALSALGEVYDPGPCARGPEPDSTETMVYEYWQQLAGHTVEEEAS